MGDENPTGRYRLRRLDRDRRRGRRRDRYCAVRGIRQRHAYRQPCLYRDWHHWPEDQRAQIIALIDPDQFADIKALSGGNVQHLLPDLRLA